MSKTQYWVCPKATCDSFLVFDDPYLPCAKHGQMIRDNEMSWRKKLWRLGRRIYWRANAWLRSKLAKGINGGSL